MASDTAKRSLIFAAFLLPFAGPSLAFAQTDQSVVIVCPAPWNGGSGQDTFTLNLTAKTVAAEYMIESNGDTRDFHHDGVITAINDQEIDWTMDQVEWEKSTLNRFTLDLASVANVTGQMIHLSCHKQERQL
jgi:hypothetical protein